MSDSEYVIDGYSILPTDDGVQIIQDGTWVGSQPTRQDAIRRIYLNRETRLHGGVRSGGGVLHA